MTARHPAINRYIVELLPYRGGEQRGLAEHLGISEAAVSRWISFQTSPSSKFWPGIADYFDIDVATIEAMTAARSVPAGVAGDRIAQLQDEVINLQARVDRIERLWDLEHPADQRINHASEMEPVNALYLAAGSAKAAVVARWDRLAPVVEGEKDRAMAAGSGEQLGQDPTEGATTSRPRGHSPAEQDDA